MTEDEAQATAKAIAKMVHDDLAAGQMTPRASTAMIPDLRRLGLTLPPEHAQSWVQGARQVAIFYERAWALLTS